VTVRLMAWAATQADAWTLATDVRETVLLKLPEIASPVGLSWSGAAPQNLAQ
jgi:hypothetical protein